jgi:hypothetical protein
MDESVVQEFSLELPSGDRAIGVIVMLAHLAISDR